MSTPRSAVLETVPVAHGGPSGTPEHPAVVDFSVTTNAFGPAPVVMEAVHSVPLDRYPDPTSRDARLAAARCWQRPLEEIAFGSGVTELLHALCFAFLRSGDSVVIPAPTFGEYERVCRLSEANMIRVPADPRMLRIDVTDVSRAVYDHRPKLVFLCAPNNPTGQRFPAEELRALADVCGTVEALLILDQAFDAFSAQPIGTPAVPGHPAVVHLRSITKDHALAGIRAGYAIGSSAIITAIERARIAWAASSVAQAAATAALSDAGLRYVDRTLAALRAESEHLRMTFTARGFRILPSDTHFFLMYAPESTLCLARHGIRVRHCASFGLRGWIRLPARTPIENALLLGAFEA